MPERQLQLAQSRALRKLRKQNSLRQLQQFCNHPDWEQESMGMNAPISRMPRPQARHRATTQAQPQAQPPPDVS